MLRRAFIAACFLVLAFVAGAPVQALAHGNHVHATQVEALLAGDADAGQADRHESKKEAASIHSHSSPVDSGPNDDCHCPACHGCCHAPALSDASVQLAPFALRSHAAPRDDGWLTRRWRSAIENPPKTFA
ncbi:MAG TPA: hypothetical protein VFY21_09360 [Xanthobacteraceae bacterium]|nr:hypothetical protein [Xanthobacteraceae bacterium]